MAGVEVLRVLIASEQGVFAVRRQARELAVALGVTGQDEIRLAASLSEVTRRLLAALGPNTVVFTVDTGAAQPVLHFMVQALGQADPGLVDALAVTRALMEEWELRTDDGMITLTAGRRLTDRTRDLSPSGLRRVASEVSTLTAGTPLDELAVHNRQLLATLAEVQAHRNELLRLNSELEETNRGVMALYTELSDELEATNRGVVALYAELDQRTEQARAANEAKTRFLANVSHELRSPVTSVVGLTRLLLDPSSDPLTGDQTDQLQLIDASANSLLGLVNELLDLAKAESGKLEPALQRTELKPIFDTLRGTLLPAISREGATLDVVEPVGVPDLHTDPVMLTQVLRNLLTNGLKFTPAGYVRLTASVTPDGWVELVVADTGIGIPADEQERVFEEFHQVRNHVPDVGQRDRARPAVRPPAGPVAGRHTRPAPARSERVPRSPSGCRPARCTPTPRRPGTSGDRPGRSARGCAPSPGCRHPGAGRRRHPVEAVHPGELAAPRRVPGHRGGYRSGGPGPGGARRHRPGRAGRPTARPDRLRGVRADQGRPGARHHAR